MNAGSVRTSTRGGRSVLRSAAAVEAAALRSLGLGAMLPLAVLGNPLAQLLDDIPDLGALDEMLDRTSDPASVRRAAAAPRSPGSRSASGRSSGPAAPVPATRGRAAAYPSSATMPGTPGTGPAPAHAAPRMQTAAGLTNPNEPAPLPHAMQNPASSGGQPHQPGAALGTPARRPAPPAPDPGEVRAAASTSALRRAARSGSRSSAGAANPATTTSRTRPGGLSNQEPAAASEHPTTLPVTPSTLHAPAQMRLGDAAPSPNLPAPVAPDFSRGGLAELVARWQDGGPSHPGPEASAASGFTPVFTAALERERPLQLGDEDRIELALTQLLRRDVERHGLEGGR